MGKPAWIGFAFKVSVTTILVCQPNSGTPAESGTSFSTKVAGPVLSGPEVQWRSVHTSLPPPGKHSRDCAVVHAANDVLTNTAANFMWPRDIFDRHLIRVA